MTDTWKKALILNLPYLLFVYFFDKLCQAVRLAPGLDASEKFLHAGKILFEEEKDFLLEKFRVVKGDVKYLSPDIKSLMLHFEKSKYGFTGISDNASKIKSLYPDILLERASIEDIMLAYVKEGE